MSDHEERVMQARVNRLEAPVPNSAATELALIASLLAAATIVAIIGAAEPIAGLIAYVFGT